MTTADNIMCLNKEIKTKLNQIDWKIFRSPKESMIIRDGKIAFIGTNEESTAFLNGNANCRIVELAGKTILPGSLFLN